MAALTNHNLRSDIYDQNKQLKPDPPAWITNPDNVHLNEHHSLGDREKIIEAANLKRKPQKNAAAAVEAMFSASAGKLQSAAEWKDYFKDCRQWLGDKFGKENILRWDEHFDEKTPHMHVIMIPIIRDKKRENKYSSSEFLGGREGLRQIQSNLADTIGKKYGLERGREGSRARHTNQYEWAGKLGQKEQLLNEIVLKQKALPEENKMLKTRLAVYEKKPPREMVTFFQFLENKGYKNAEEYHAQSKQQPHKSQTIKR